MELFHTSTSTSAPPFSNNIFSSKSILQLYNQEANISFDLFTVSVESIEGTAAENSTFATPRDTTTGQIFSLNVLDSLVWLQKILVRIIQNNSKVDPQMR